MAYTSLRIIKAQNLSDKTAQNIIVLATRGFPPMTMLQLRASALTFILFSLLFLLLPLLFAIAKGFGLDQTLDSIITGTKEFQLYGELLHHY
jgi:hypothetical protein